MGRVANKEILLPGPMFTPLAAPPAEDGGFWSAAGAAFTDNNDAHALSQWLTRPEFKTDYNFDFESAVKKMPLYLQYPEAYNNVRSLEELFHVDSQVAIEHGRRQKMEANGWGAFLGGMTGALLSPTTLIPAGAAVRGTKMASILGTAAKVGLSGAGAVALQEGVLQEGSYTRPMSESATNVLFTLALGGMIGGAVGSLSAREINKLASGMAKDLTSTAIHVPGIDGPSIHGERLDPQSLSAAVNPNPERTGLGEVTGIAPSVPGLQSTLGELNPVSRVLGAEYSPTARNMMGSLDSGGLYTSGGATNIGGDVASLSKQWHYLNFNALRKRAELMGGNFVTRMMGVRDFSKEVAYAMRRGGEGSTPEVTKMAEYVKKEVYDKLLAEARTVNMQGFDKITPEFAQKYVNRMYRKGLVVKNHDLFVGMLQEHFTDQITKNWTKSLERTTSANLKAQQSAEDLTLAPTEAIARAEQLDKELRQLSNTTPLEIQLADTQIRNLRRQATAAKRSGDYTAYDTFVAQARALEEQHKAGLEAFPKKVRALAARRDLIRRGMSGLETRQRGMLEQIDLLEQKSAEARDRLVRKAEKTLAKLDDLSDRALDEELAALEEEVKKAYASYERMDSRIAKMKELPPEFIHLEYSDVRPTEKISVAEARQLQREEKLNQLLDGLESAKSMDREAARMAVREVVSDAVEKTEKTNFKRMKQVELLNERIKKADPARAAAEAQSLTAKAAEREYKFLERAAADNIKLTGGRLPQPDGTQGPFSLANVSGVDVSGAAEELDNHVTNKIIGDAAHMPFLTIMKERGPELARMLNIDETRVFKNGASLEQFLENDSEFLMRSYVRTMGSDIEMMRKFGTVNPLAKDSLYLKSIQDEYNAARKTARETLEGAKLEKQLTAIQKEQSDVIRDLQAVIDRERHVRGVPEDADAIGYRIGKTLRAWNVTRMMGNMAITSAVDLSALVIKHGFLGTFRDGLIPLMTAFKTAKLSMHEAQMAGVGLDLILHGRAAAIYDVLDEVRGGTLFERGMHFASNQMGTITGMDRWNSGMKQLGGMMSITRTAKDIEKAVLQNNAKSIRRLDRLGIDEVYRKAIWKKLEESGTKEGGVYLPNMEDWHDPELMRVFRGAIARQVDDMIVTPGAERPLWMDGSETGRLLGQFRSFTFSSTQKILWAGAQDARSGEPAVFGGMVFSVALGMLSYYIKETLASPERAERVRNASTEKMVLEGIKNSMLLGVLAEAQRSASEIPGAVGGAATLGSGRIDRFPGSGPVMAAMGPTAGFIRDMDNALTGAFSGDMKNADISAVQRLTPYNNVFWLARQFDRVSKEFKK